MILQSKGGCYLTEAADVKIEHRHFVTTVFLANPSDAGKWREVTETEKEKMLQAGTIFDVEQLSPAYLDKVDALLAEIPAAMNNVTTFTKVDALKYKDYYPEWGDKNVPMGKEVPDGFLLRNGGKLYEVRQPHTLQKEWEPGAQGTEALYTLVQVDYEENPDGHSGTLEDPIPYEGNQMLEEGKYYSQDGKTYLCTRDSGIPLTHALSELVGLYVEEITENN